MFDITGRKALTKKDKITFGKYKNHTVKWIAENDPGYIVWMSENVPFPIVRQKIIDKCFDCITDRLSFWEDDEFDYWEWWKE